MNQTPGQPQSAAEYPCPKCGRAAPDTYSNGWVFCDDCGDAFDVMEEERMATTETSTIYVTPEHLGSCADEHDARAYAAELEETLRAAGIEANVRACAGINVIPEEVEDEVTSIMERLLERGQWVADARDLRGGR